MNGDVAIVSTVERAGDVGWEFLFLRGSARGLGERGVAVAVLCAFRNGGIQIHGSCRDHSDFSMKSSFGTKLNQYLSLSSGRAHSCMQ